MTLRLDLHLHTTFSDGSETPTDVVRRAAAGGLGVIAITDHDTAGGVPEAIEAAGELELEVIPGAELSSSHDGRELHILGYGLDPFHEGIRAHADHAWTKRRARMEAILENLREQADIHITLEEVREAAEARNPMVGRPHLARVLVDRGYVRDIPAAFDEYIADDCPAFVPTELGSPADAIAVIREAGGVAVWAHPPGDLLEELLRELVDSGLQGLEAYRPRWPARKIRHVEEYAALHDLVLTGGSDWHNASRNGSVGDFWVQSTRVQRFLHLLD